MAGQKKTRARAQGLPDDVARTSQNSRTQSGATSTRSKVFRELLETSAAKDIYPAIRTGVSTSDALQMCLDRAVEVWRFLCDQVDIHAMEVDEHGEAVGFFDVAPTVNDPTRTIPNRWYLAEREAREDVVKVSGLMTQLGIAERAVRVQEAQAAMLAAAVRDAAIEAGFSGEDVRRLGEALRHRAESVVAAPASNGSPAPGGALPHRSPQSRPPSRSNSLAQDPATSRAVAKEGPGH